jgi:2-polyprenyl-6-methoxyphenol hydroxylase-like FAD-dependent oxidoreductase
MEHIMRELRILISGASIAGPSLAYWLSRHGFKTTVVERAPALRGGGFGVDFRGPVHLGLLERMGILDEVNRHQTGMGDLVFVNADGRVSARLPSFVTSGDVEIERGDLSRILHERTRDTTEYLLGNSIVALGDEAQALFVTFESGESRVFDLVIGADGLHSHVRRLAWGDERQFLRFAGWYFAGDVQMPNDLNLHNQTLSYSEPGRTISLSSGRDSRVVDVSFVFAAEELAYDRRDLEAQKALVAERFAGIGWLGPKALAALREARSLYFDSLSQIHMDYFVRGRIALGGDHRVGFANYQREITPYARGCQKLADGAGPFLAPRTKGEIRRREIAYRLLSSRLLAGFFNGLTTKAARAIKLKEYETSTLYRAA